MKLLKAFATASAICTSLTIAAPAKAGCYPALAANIIVPIIRETGDYKLALWEAHKAGYFDLNDGCNARTLSYVKRYGNIILIGLAGKPEV